MLCSARREGFRGEADRVSPAERNQQPELDAPGAAAVLTQRPSPEAGRLQDAASMRSNARRGQPRGGVVRARSTRWEGALGPPRQRYATASGRAHQVERHPQRGPWHGPKAHPVARRPRARTRVINKSSSRPQRGRNGRGPGGPTLVNTVGRATSAPAENAQRHRDGHRPSAHDGRGPGHGAVQQSAATDERPQFVTDAGSYAGRRPRDSDRRRRPAVPVD